MREMKDSGIEWIGEIPKEWKLCKPKYFGKIRSGDSITNNKLNDESGYEVFGGNGIIGYYYQYNTEGINIIIGRVGALCGNVRIVDGKNFISDNALIFTCVSDANVKYVYYLFEAFELNRLNTSNAQPLITGFKVLNIVIPFPNLREQEKISSYLDACCSEIDATVEDIQKEINILEDYKKSVITEAVTKGLDPNVEMKDSGIEWIGEIPREWSVHPIYSFFTEGKTSNYRMQESNLLSLSYGKIIRKDINTNGGLLPANFTSYNIVSSGDIIIRPTDLQNDKRSLRTGLVKENGIITSAYIDLVPKKCINSRYYHYLLHSYDISKVFYNMGNGVRQGLNFSEFAKLLMLEPPKVEQQQIADYLDTRCAEIDSLIVDKKKQLELLADYKKSLIYEYVTGKKEVPTQN